MFLVRYDTINWAGSYFAVAFAIEALLLVWTGLVRNRLSLRPPRDLAGAAGLCLFVLALLAWPLVTPLLGRSWLQAEVFGVAPDPTVVATLGVLVAAERPRWELFVVPLLWCAVGGATLWTMQSADALLMPAAALLALALAGWKMMALQSRVPGECSEAQPSGTRPPISGLPEIGTQNARKSGKPDLR
jgi:hypothetical protein